MANRHRRRRKSTLTDIISLIGAIAMIVIAVVLMIFVYTYIRQNRLPSGLPFLSSPDSGGKDADGDGADDKDGKDARDGKDGKDADGSGEEGEGEDGQPAEGLNRLKDGTLVLVLSDNEAKTYPSDSVLAKDGQKLLAGAWYEDGDSLYYFGDDGLAVREHTESGMRYRFSKDYILEEIRYLSNYRADPGEESAEYPGLVRGKKLWAYLDEKKSVGNYYAVRYKQTTEARTQELGGGSNPQYSSRYAMAVLDNYIYYLAVDPDSGSGSSSGSGSASASGSSSGSSTGKALAPIAGKLMRMQPGGEFREIAAENVKGFRVVREADGGHKVYYDDGSGIHISRSFTQDETMRIFPENASYYVEIRNDKAVLMLEGGYPVTLESAAFSAGNFIYRLSASGEILSVAAKTNVSLGGYSYFVENGESFGEKRARVMRQDAAGTIEVISAEFPGETGNLHYDFDSGRMIAEYKDAYGAAGLVSITRDGDVDLLADTAYVGSRAELYAIRGGEAYIRTDDSLLPFRKVRISGGTPLAAGVDPVVLETDEPAEDESQADGPGGPGTAQDYDSTVQGENTSVEKLEGPPAGGSSAGSEGPGTGAVVSQGPGADNGAGSDAASSAAPGEITIINDHAVEKKGPGES